MMQLVLLQVFTEKLGYMEMHALMNGRLILCTLAVGFALFAVAWDYFFPFPASRPVLITCVLSYPFGVILIKVLLMSSLPSRAHHTFRCCSC